MSIPKALSCVEVKEVLRLFLGGNNVKELSKTFDVSRLTISRLLKGETYKSCEDARSILPDDFLDTLQDTLKANMRLSRGRGVKK